MSNELLPCPFCDGEAHAFHVGDWWVEHACKKLGTYIRTRFCETEEEAIAWWNTRAERTCKKLPPVTGHVCEVHYGSFSRTFDYWRCSECDSQCVDGAKFCMNCGVFFEEYDEGGGVDGQ